MRILEKLLNKVYQIDLAMDVLSRRKLKYLKLVHVTSSILMLLYFLRYNFEYHVYIFNFLFIPCLTINFYLAFYVKAYTKFVYINLANIIVLLVGLIWTAGGIDAPGIIWFSALPLVTGILLDSKKSFITAIFVFLIFISFIVLKNNGIEINLINQFFRNEDERVVNLFTFSIYLFLTTIFFIKNEMEFRKEISTQSHEVENLLRLILHDISSPLSVITMNSELMAENPDSITPKQIQRMVKAVSNINNFINKMRIIRACKDGKRALAKEKVNVNLLIQEIKADTITLFERKQLSFMLNLNAQIPEITTDSFILKQIVILNLITNAVKFSEIKGSIFIETDFNAESIFIKIRDEGIGIPKELQKDLFETHKKTNRNGTAGEAGTGYGLPLVYDFVTKMGGKIHFVSNEKTQNSNVEISTSSNILFKGTTFTITLPIERT